MEDASATIDQMGSGSKEGKTARPKLRLTDEAEQADVQGDSGDGMALELKGHVKAMIDADISSKEQHFLFIAECCNPENFVTHICCFFFFSGVFVSKLGHYFKVH